MWPFGKTKDAKVSMHFVAGLPSNLQFVIGKTSEFLSRLGLFSAGGSIYVSQFGDFVDLTGLNFLFVCWLFQIWLCEKMRKDIFGAAETS